MKPTFSLVAALICAAIPAFAVPVSVTVVGPDNKPLADAKLSSFETPFVTEEVAAMREQSGAGGVFRWEWDGDFDDKRPLGERQFLRVRVSAPGMATQLDWIQRGQTTVRLMPTRSWGGTVVDKNQKPVAGVTLQLGRVTPATVAQAKPQDEGYGAFVALDNTTAVTDADGRWSVPGLPARGTIIVEVDDERFVKESLELAIGEGDAAPILVKEGGKVSGIVLAPDGTPLAGETVRAGFGANIQTTTDANGRFTLAGIAPGEVYIYGGEVSFVAQRKGKLPAQLFEKNPSAQVEAGKTTDVGAIKTIKGLLVRARVIGADTKAPLTKAQLRIGYSNPVSVVDAEGNLQARLAPDATRNAFRNPIIANADYVDYALSPLLLQSKESTLDLGTIEMKRGARITGKIRIQDSDDISRLPGISFSRGGDTRLVNVDKNGQFQSLPLEAGSYWVNLNERGNDWEIVSPRTVSVPEAEAAAKPIEVVVKRLTPFLPLLKEARGRLLDAEGQGVAGATISARLQMEGGMSLTSTALTDANGDYVFKSNFGKIVGAEVSGGEHPTYLIGGKTEVSIRDGIATINGLVAKKRGAIFAGRVVGTDGKPAANAWVAVIEARDYEPIQTGADGAFQMADVPLDKFTLLAAHDRDWARVAVESIANGVKVELQKPVEFDNRDAAVAQLMKIPDDTRMPTDKLFENWDALGADVIEQFIRRNGPPDAAVVAMFGAEMARREPAAFLKRAPALLESVSGEARENLEAQLNLVRAQSDDAGERVDAGAWLDEQKGVKREINVRSVTQLLQMAAVARKLEREDASQWLDYAAAVAAQLGGDNDRNLSAWSSALAAWDDAAVVRFAEGWKVPDEFRLWNSLARVWARAGEVESAQKALARMEALLAQPEMVEAARDASKNYRAAPADSVDAVRSAIASALASSDAPAAFALADQIVPIFSRARAMLNIADKAGRAGDAKVAEKALRDMMKARIGGGELIALAASLGAQSSPQLGEELFAAARARTLGTDKRRPSFAPSIGMWAFYHAPTDPAQSRVLIEHEWNWRLPAAIKTKDESFSSDINDLYYLIKGMAAVDAARAAEMQAVADAIETKSYGKTVEQIDLAVIALATPAQRARFGVDARY